MASWSNLLIAEARAIETLRFEESNTENTLFSLFKPNDGGQAKFFELQNWKSLKPPIAHRWTALVGGIGCVAAETMINGVPIADRKKPALVKTLLGYSEASAGYIKGRDNLYCVTTSRAKIVVTLDHIFLTPRGWLPLRLMELDQQIAVNNEDSLLPQEHCIPSPKDIFYAEKMIDGVHPFLLSQYCVQTDNNKEEFNPFWDKILSIKFVRNDFYYDIHVPGINHYEANGIINHNSGKSFSGAAWACSRALLDPKARGMITANSYPQLSTSTLVELINVCRAYDIPILPYREGVEDNAMAIANCRYCYLGEDKAFVFVKSAGSFEGKKQTGRGLQIRWVWADEFAYASEKAFQTIDGRLGRGSGSMKGQGVISTSPVGYNWLWNKFGDPTREENIKKIFQIVTVSSLENIAHLGKEYAESLKANYTDELYEQEVMGSFINTAKGLVYNYFSRLNHTLSGVDAELLDYEPSLPLLLSFDFNASPCVCIAAQKRGEEIHFFKEWFLLDADLWLLCEAVKTWIIKNDLPPEIQIFGDATGRARTAQSRLTSWDIVWQTLSPLAKAMGGQLVRRFADSNPYVVNRVHSVNLAYKQDRCFIHLVNCKELVKDFETMTWDDKGINKDDVLRSHLSDAAGYMIHGIAPFKAHTDLLGIGKNRPRNIAV